MLQERNRPQACLLLNFGRSARLSKRLIPIGGIRELLDARCVSVSLADFSFVLESMNAAVVTHAPMTQFPVVDDCLQVGGISLTELARRVGRTPFYAYDRSLMT